MTFLVGLTGGIATGKSTVTDCFERLSVPIIDADQIARALLQPDNNCYHTVISAFGDEIRNEDLSINRANLREQIFNNKDKKQLLESILHPAIREELFQQANQVTTPYCILSIPLLVESNMHSLVDRILVVDALPEQQLSRLIERDDITETLALKMIEQQVHRLERLSFADDIIHNDGDKEQVENQVNVLHEKYLSLAP